MKPKQKAALPPPSGAVTVRSIPSLYSKIELSEEQYVISSFFCETSSMPWR